IEPIDRSLRFFNNSHLFYYPEGMETELSYLETVGKKRAADFGKRGPHTGRNTLLITGRAAMLVLHTAEETASIRS
ncbi:hypothetical protein, partial [Halococcus hamelinensis]|uniref:hypothetical protein n=1 Tax=Halococcus hamelinensis TaxID=332168 RepID=UPI001ED8DB24